MILIHSCIVSPSLSLLVLASGCRAVVVSGTLQPSQSDIETGGTAGSALLHFPPKASAKRNPEVHICRQAKSWRRGSERPGIREKDCLLGTASRSHTMSLLGACEQERTQNVLQATSCLVKFPTLPFPFVELDSQSQVQATMGCFSCLPAWGQKMCI